MISIIHVKVLRNETFTASLNTQLLTEVAVYSGLFQQKITTRTTAAIRRLATANRLCTSIPHQIFLICSLIIVQNLVVVSHVGPKNSGDDGPRPFGKGAWLTP